MACTTVDKEGISDAYEEVRDDKNPVNWAVFKYEGSQVIVGGKGVSFDDFKSQFEDDGRAFGYIRIQTGDEMSRRCKFMMVTWVGTEVSAMKRAKMSTDKALIKEVLVNFALELTLENSAEFDEDAFKSELGKIGGANYGTGVRA